MKVVDSSKVAQLLDQIPVFDAVEKMFLALGRGEAVQPPQVQTLFPNDAGDYINYSGIWANEGVYGLKTSPYIATGERPIVTAWTLLMSMKTGQPLLLVDSSALTLERTAATTALAVKLLAKPNAKRLVVIGSGAQAVAHIRYVKNLRNWESIVIWSPHLTKKEVRESLKQLDFRVSLADSKQEALKKADVVMLCTSSAHPVLELEELNSNALITSISTNAYQAHEVNPKSLSEMDVYCDCKSTTFDHAGEMILAKEHFGWSSEEIKGDLGALLNNQCSLPDYNKPVFFRSIGQGLEDIAVAVALLSRLSEKEDL